VQTPTEQTVREPVGAQGEACAECGAQLAPDQRYCINCGRRRGDPRVPLPAGTAKAAGPAPPAAASDARPNDVSPLGAVLGVALLGGMLLIGVLIGRGGSDEETPAPVIQVGDNAAASTTTTTADQGGDTSAGAAAITSDWPAGTEGFTVQLSTVPKAGATEESVDAARSSAEAQGASEVGVLDSDVYPSLAPGSYVIYSGVYDTRSEAADGLKSLESSFPTAQVVEVSTTTTSENEAAPQDSTGGITDIPGADNGQK
jgi:hypothetical protein